ncbi:MAG: hypothetical protein II734_06735 [Paludibacteraceae bacterium]|nr:hypothetical protein [Paludibacteraceae bacterium]MBQ3896785.1 hypothetical protein [Paludibacteraceae bacterium]
MKKTYLCIVASAFMAVMGVSCSKSAESAADGGAAASADSVKADAAVEEENVPQKGLSEEDAVIIEFITDMYNNEKFSDYGFLNEHCTPRLKKKLRDKYDYDCEDGDCYAVWLFRTSHQDGTSDRHEIVKIVPEGDNWYTYDFYDMGIKGRNRVRAFVKDGVVMMDDILNILQEE